MSGVDPDSVVNPDAVAGSFVGERHSYEHAELTEADVDRNPIAQLRLWLGDAERSGVLEPTAMAISTVRSDGTVSSRTVLMRQIVARGPVFFTNYNSDKGLELAANPNAAALLWWAPLQRQVRIEGRVERLSEAESDAYFAGRPRGSQIGAWASPQSSVLVGRDELEATVAAVERRFEGVEQIPRPPFWGGLALVADRIEFWQGRRSRLHDRLFFERSGDEWTMVRLAP